jgi:hypothetical protein
VFNRILVNILIPCTGFRTAARLEYRDAKKSKVQGMYVYIVLYLGEPSHISL